MRGPLTFQEGITTSQEKRSLKGNNEPFLSASFFSHGFRVNSHADEVPLSIDAVFRLILNILMELMRRRVPSEMEDRKCHRKCITIQISFSKKMFCLLILLFPGKLHLTQGDLRFFEQLWSIDLLACLLMLLKKFTPSFSQFKKVYS